MDKRLKSGPRTPYGYLDAALQELEMAAHTSPHLNTDEDVKRKRAAIIQRVRRIVRGEVKAVMREHYLGKFGE